MNRGDVYLADLEPVRGAESNSARPVVLVGNNASLQAAVIHGRGVVSIVPCTTNTNVRGPMHVTLRSSRLNGLRIASKAQAEQVRSIEVDRLLSRLGQLATNDIEALDDALRYHLDL